MPSLGSLSNLGFGCSLSQMLLRKSPIFTKQFSTSTGSVIWRSEIKQREIATQISSILLQRRNWFTLLHNLHFSSTLTPSLFLQVLNKTQHHPQVSLDFFNWARTKIEPDLKCLCRVIHVSIRAGNTLHAKPILASLIQIHSVSVLVETLIRSSTGGDFDSQCTAFDCVIECYAQKGLFVEAVEVFRKMVVNGFTPSLHACNTLLEILARQNEFGLAWCLNCVMVKIGHFPDSVNWSLLAQITCKSGKFERIVRWLDMGFGNYVLYDLVVDYYCKEGDFVLAFGRLDEMCSRNFNPSFSTYSSVLDGACKFGDCSVIEKTMCIMVEKGLLPPWPYECDSVLKQLCDLRKTYALQMFFRRTCDECVGLQDATYGCMLRTFSEEERVEDAITVHRVISAKKIAVKDCCYDAFVNALCKQEQSVEVTELLIQMIGRGFTPRATELSKRATSLCNRGSWREAEDILNAVIEKGWMLDSFCCSALMEHYCSTRRIDTAMELHNKMAKLNGSLDITTYNILLDGLSKKRRIGDAVNVFDYMRGQNLVDSVGFSIMINLLCREKELRTAMKLHDEMLKMGLKPDKAEYRRLISGFK